MPSSTSRRLIRDQVEGRRDHHADIYPLYLKRRLQAERILDQLGKKPWVRKCPAVSDRVRDVLNHCSGSRIEDRPITYTERNILREFLTLWDAITLFERQDDTRAYADQAHNGEGPRPGDRETDLL